MQNECAYPWRDICLRQSTDTAYGRGVHGTTKRSRFAATHFERKVNTGLDKWYWLRDSSFQPYRWVYGRNQFTNKFDPSDAGMTWWLMSGGPNRGDDHAGWPEAKALLDWKLNGSTNKAPTVSAGPDRTVTLPGSASLDGTVSDDGLPAGAAVILDIDKGTIQDDVWFSSKDGGVAPVLTIQP